MTLCSHFLTRLLQCFMGICLLALPLQAQLDPRLQVGNTDFLDLYQQSSNAKVKPEIITIFDFSGSMDALMYHPLFVNTDASDGQASGNITFTLNPAIINGNNTYTIRVTSNQNSNVYATVDVTVGGGLSNPFNSGEKSQQVQPGGNNTRKYLYTSITDISVQGGNPATFNSGSSYTFVATVSLRATDRNGNSIAVSSYGTTTTGITWSVSGGGTASSISSAGVWIAPALQSTSTVSPVTASLRGNTVGTLTSTYLVKPDGSVVTTSDANAADTGSGFYGASFGASDVRNWVRAASHARFQYNDSGTTRTIDVPIPWKITDVNSTLNPLRSRTVLDSVNRSTGTVGSGQAIELDLNYTLSGGSQVLSGNSSQQTTTTLNTVSYKRFYVDWLFLGKYGVGSYSTPTAKYIVFDADNASLAGGQGNVNWGKGYGNMSTGDKIQVPVFNLNGTYANREETKSASMNVIPPFSRCQASKRAAIETWIQYQDKVIWAFRFLDPSNEANGGAATTIDNNSKTTLSGSDPTTTVMNGSDSGWTLLNNTSASPTNSVTGMKRIAALFANNNTPLTYATARALAQFTDPNSVFNAFETGTNAPNQCMNHFLILFTDGVDNNGTGTNNTNGSTPYLVPVSGLTTINASAGNAAIIGNPTSIDRYGSNWNLFTFSGIAAHMGDPAFGTLGTNYLDARTPTANDSGTPPHFLPFAIKSRNTGLSQVTFQKPHLVTTMTVGVSLGGQYSDASSPKRSLFLAAAIGDPSLSSWSDISTLTPFVWLTADEKKQDGSIYFFDATNPQKLADDLDKALLSATRTTNTNATSNPNLPFIGAAYGRQVYLGKFRPPSNGGAIWPGDLMMFGTRQVGDQTLIVDKNNNLATTIDASTAIWSTSKAMTTNRLWNARKLFTRIPGTLAVPEPGLSSFSDNGTAYTDAGVGLKNFVAINVAAYATDATKMPVIQFAAGGDTSGALDGSGRPTTTRSNVMGDIVNSSPGVLEYKFSDVQGSLSSALGASVSAATGVTNRFRLLLVGTNQGWLHAFGEVTNVTKITTAGPNFGQDQVNGSVDELWAFMPTDFLANLQYITIPTNPHQFMVDGTPAIYFLDLPPTSGGSGNGVLDIGSDPTTTKERAIAIVGLRKGGRSYYALDIHNPFNPKLQWSLVPDEANYFPASRIASGANVDLTTVRSILKNWGFSTCTPGLGRIMFGGVLKDAVFLGGGFSHPEIEAHFLDAAGDPTPLGRSIIALDVYTGEVLAAVDMSGTTAGPITSGLVPFEFFLNSGMGQRAYFLDYNGGLWSWGKQATASTGTYTNYRTDSSEITDWSVRKVAQDGSGKNALYSTLPAPFRVGTFPGQGLSGAPSPAAVGVAMISGDRNNPLDYLYSAGTTPTQHRLTMVFDRQDHKVWDNTDGAITDSALISAGTWVAPAVPSTTAFPSAPTSLQAGNALITPGSQTYYLAPHDAMGNFTTPKLGYYANLPVAANGFIPKGINSPLVVAGALFYSYFSPQEADPCLGGSGFTYANLICDVLNPIMDDTRTTVSCKSGTQFVWSGVASDFVTIGTQGVLQGGVVPANNPVVGQDPTIIQLKTILGNRLERFPKVRTWRTIH